MTHTGENLSLVKEDYDNGDFIIKYEGEDEAIPYYSHWFTKDEVRSLFANHNLALTSIKEDGVRLLIKGRKP